MSTQPSYGLQPEKKSGLWKLYVFLVSTVTLFVVASWWATQGIAEAYSFHTALGKPVFGHFYAPWKWLAWWRQFPSSTVIDQAISEGAMLFIFPQLIVLGFLFTFSRRPKGTKNIHGSAQWATEADIARMGFFDNKGVYVGGWVKKYVGQTLLMRTLKCKPQTRQVYLRHSGPQHVLVFAPTRSGKGVGLVLPTLLSWLESTLVLDIKGENYELTAGWRKSIGHKILRFDPKNVTRTVRFNPLAEIRLYQDEAVQDAQAIATILLDPDGKGLKEYFDKAAFAFFTGAVLHCLIINLAANRTATMNDLAMMFTDPDKSTDELLTSMIETDHVKTLGNSCRFAKEIHDLIASSAQEMLNKADRERSGVLSSAGVNLSIYKDPTVAYATSYSDFRVEDLMNHDVPVSLYLVISPADIDRLRPLTRLILNVILCRLTEEMDFKEGRSVLRFKHRLLLMLDEFTSQGNLAILERALAYMAGYGIIAYLIVQDLTQLQKAYSKEEAIMSNCHIRIAFAPNKPETAKILSDMTGKTTIVEYKTSVSGSRGGHLKNASVSVQEVARPLLTPDECMRLPGIVTDANGQLDAGDMLIFVAGNPAIYGKQILYFRDPVFSQRAKISAPATDRLYGDDGVIRPAKQKSETSPSSTPEEEIYDAALAISDSDNH
ncbi:type IV secretory system conjugative DNA transfer family protein [Desulfovibrio falkowii]|uniref:Conjugal transfer protein TraG n=1 Tax=Desulfovibrio falkowii TaxID=3136602 RepID=A0ABQ0E5X2_9BACT